jgi:hypothetical protein
VTGSADGKPARVDLETWLVAQRDTLDAFVRKRAGKLLLRLETAEDLAQGVCAHLLARAEAPEQREEAALRAWLFKVSDRWLADRRDHWTALKRRGGDVLRLTFGDTDSAELRTVRELAASVTGPSTFAVRREQLALAALALDMLLPRDRELIEGMCAGVELDEQARRLAISYDAAERARLRAVERFRRCFQIVVSGQGG